MFYPVVMYTAVALGIAMGRLEMVVAGVGLLAVYELRPRGRHE